MPQIAILCEFATLNGGERSMLATLGGIRAAGFEPVVIAPARGALAEAISARDVEHIAFQCAAEDGTRTEQSRLREELSAVLQRRRPAILHANSLAMGRLSGPVATELRLPSLAHVRDIVGLSARAIANLNCHTRLLAVSHATRAFHVAAGLDAEKTHVLYNGVDLDKFRPRPPTGWLHCELNLPFDAQLVGTIGQIGLRKGQDVLLRAAASIVERTPNAHYIIVGERHSEKDESRAFERGLHELAEASLCGKVHFLGTRGDVERFLNELTLLVHPARQEPLGRVLLEAAAAGVAVVATNVGGTSEIFLPGTARLVPPDDETAMADAMADLLGDPAERRRLGIAARRCAEDQFDIRAAAENLVEHYRSLSTDGSGSGEASPARRKNAANNR